MIRIYHYDLTKYAVVASSRLPISIDDPNGITIEEWYWIPPEDGL